MEKVLFELFLTFLKIGSLSIGGGYAIIPLIQEEIVSTLNWISIKEYTDIITISQMTPGPLVVNTASFVGLRIAGIFGAILATIGSTLSGSLIATGLYTYFSNNKDLSYINTTLKSLRASSLGLIASAGASLLLISIFNGKTMTLTNLNVVAICIFIVAIISIRVFKTNPLIIIGLSGLAGLLLYS